MRMALSNAEMKARRKKIKDDGRQLVRYRERLENTRKTYMQTFEADAINQRRSREAALGACALKAIDAARELAKGKKLVDGTLDYMITEQKMEDPDGRIGFHCSVSFQVISTERAFNDEEINKEIMDTFEKMMMETDELFPVEEKDEKGESEGAAV